MRFVVLGAGRIGQAHIATLHAQAGVTDIFVGDLDQTRAREAAAQIDSAYWGSIDDAFAFRPDGIVIAAPTSVHAELIIRAVRAKIPTFCEKPLAGSLASSLAVVTEVERHNVAVQIGFQRRFDAGYLAAKEALHTGAIGELRRMHMTTCDPAPPPAEFIPLSGGIYRDCHIHDFDILRWITGREVVSVYAAGANRGAQFFADAGDVDESVAVLTMDDGTLVTLQGSRYNGAGYDVRLEMAGTQGNRAVGLDDRSPLTSAEPGSTFAKGQPWPNFQERFAHAYAAELAHFIAVSAGEALSPCTPRDALEALYIAEAAEVSRAEQRPVALTEVRP